MAGRRFLQYLTTRRQAPHFSALPRRSVASLLLIIYISFALASCSSVSDQTLVNAGRLLLQHALDSSYNEELGRYRRGGANWLGNASSEGRLDPERMPEWAAGKQFIACVYWEDEFLIETTVAQPGPDMVRIRHGIGWGWVLLSKDLAFHVLETNLRWTVTEDGVETESESHKYVDAWDTPAEKI